MAVDFMLSLYNYACFVNVKFYAYISAIMISILLGG